jgi:hypothetical protein
VASDCYGSAWTDNLPFRKDWFDSTAPTDYYTNAGLWAYFHPAANKVDYIYDQFSVRAPRWFG